MTVRGPVEILFPGAHLRPAVPGVGHFTGPAALRRYATAYRTAAGQLPPGLAWTLGTRHGRVRAYRFGEESAGRTPVMLLSGRNAGTPSWAPALPALLRRASPVLALDSLGEAGCSSQTTPLDTPSDQAAWVAESVHALGLERVHLVAHSLGGWVATHVARHRPDVLASVTVLDPPATFAPVGAGFSAAGLAAAGLPLPPAVRRGLLAWIAGGSRGSAPVPGAAALEDLGLVGLQTFRVRQPPPSRPADEDLRAPAVPALAVFGGRSRVHDAEAAARNAQGLGWRVELWPDAGHTLHVDFAGRLAGLVRGQVEASER